MTKLPSKPRRGDFTKEVELRECRDRIQHFIHKETKLGEFGLAKLCRCSPEAARDFLAGPARDDHQEMKLNIERTIARYRQKWHRDLPKVYASTDPARIIESSIMYAIQQRGSGAVLADSGLGKTTAARLIAVRETSVVFIACDCNDFRPAAFVSRILVALGMSQSRCVAIWEKQRDIVDRLEHEDLVIVLDDAHLLLNPKTPARSASLDVLKDLNCHAGTPFVLLGVPELWTVLNKRSTGGWFDQLLSRISMPQTIRREMISEGDVGRIAESLGVNCTAPAIKALTELAHRPGGFRNVEKAARWAKRLGASQLTRDSLEQYFRMTGTEGIVIGKESQASRITSVAAKEQKTDSAVA